MTTPHSRCTAQGIFQGSCSHLSGTFFSSGTYFLMNLPFLSWSSPCLVTE